MFYCPTLNEFKKQNKTKYWMISIEQFKNKKSVRYFQIFENDLGFSTGVPSLVSSTEPRSFYTEINYLNFYFKITNLFFEVVVILKNCWYQCQWQRALHFGILCLRGSNLYFFFSFLSIPPLPSKNPVRAAEKYVWLIN